MASYDHIKVWPFKQAPNKYQDLSQHGGDEDWLAFVPGEIWENCEGYIPWIDKLGCCEVSEHPVKGGIVFIVVHA